MPISIEKSPQDAPAALDTGFGFAPHSDGSFDEKNNTFTGTLETSSDVDWIVIDLRAGKEYTIGVKGADTGGVNDTILKLLDSKGGIVEENDDVDGAKGELNSAVMFTPKEDAKYYISVSAFRGNPSVDNKGAYTVTVTEKDVGPADITGTEKADKLTGTDAGEKIDGAGGDDELKGGSGNDDLKGGGGNDLLVGGSGADTLSGGAGDDTISYEDSEEGVTINLLTGTAKGGDADGDEIVDNDKKDDRVENVQGSMYDDRLTGNDEANKLWGLDGNDELNGGGGGDILSGGAGDDALDGGDDNDTLEGGAGADELTGGKGMNTASYENSEMGVTVRLHASKAMGGDAEGDTFGGMVTVKYTDEDGDPQGENLPDIVKLTGSAHDDILAGDFRDNVIEGGAGNDRLYGGPGGGDGKGDDSNVDTLRGEAGDDKLYGGAGNDMLEGGAGSDVLWGGPGKDTYEGGAGDDTIHADKYDVMMIDGDDKDDATENGKNDTVSYAKLEEGVIRSLGETTEENDVTFTINNVENIIGSQGVDTLTGDEEDNIIEGGESGDTLKEEAEMIPYPMPVRMTGSGYRLSVVELPPGGTLQVIRSVAS